jgi:hypothetical protein
MQFLGSSVADPGFFSRIPDSTTAAKEGENLLFYLFCSLKFENYFIFV